MKLRVLSYNIHKGFDLFGTQFVLHEIKEAIRQTHADLVLLQEVVGEHAKHKRSHKKWPKEAQFEFLADTIWPHFSYGKNAVFTQRHHGNAILSKYPILTSENINISTNRLERRGLLHCEIALPHSKFPNLHVFNVHLDLWERGRRKQLRQIIERAKSFVPADAPFIIGGDFNDWSESVTRVFNQEIGLAESFLLFEGSHAQSFPSYFPMLRLDRLYVRQLQVLKARTLQEHPWRQLSDHLPILAELEIS